MEINTIEPEKKDAYARKISFSMRQLIEIAGVSVYAIAKKMGVAPQQLHTVVHAQDTCPNVYTLHRFAAALGCELTIGFRTVGAPDAHEIARSLRVLSDAGYTVLPPSGAVKTA